MDAIRDKLKNYIDPLTDLYNTISNFSLTSNNALCDKPNDFEGSFIDGTKYSENKKELKEQLEKYKYDIKEFSTSLEKIPQTIDNVLSFLEKIPNRFEDINNMNLQDISN